MIECEMLYLLIGTYKRTAAAYGSMCYYGRIEDSCAWARRLAGQSALP